MIGITSFGAYIPRRRLQRKCIAQANAWFAPNLVGAAKGERSMANFDEDAVTLGVEAARICLPGSDPLSARAHVEAVYFASTSLPFADRQNAGIIAAALNLPNAVSSGDFTASQRAGTSALLAGLDAVKAGRAKTVLVVAGENRKARAASAQEMQYGDAGAAVTLGEKGVVAKIVGSHSLTIDFVDHFRGDGAEFDYVWEERWIRDEGYAKIVPAAVQGLLEKTSMTASDVAYFVMPCSFSKLDQQVAKVCGIDPSKVRDSLMASVGDTGAAHALLMLAHVLEESKPGDKILVAQFGQGCEVLLFEVTPEILRYKRDGAVTASLKKRKEETNYMKYLAFNGLVEFEKGMRSEVDKKTALSVLYRKNDMILGLVGGKCRTCGTAQFPRTRMCVNPNCRAVDSQDGYGFSELEGTVLSWSADFLTFSMDPPNHYGMVTFAEGGRFLADITDVEQGQVDSGMKVRMSFRVKDVDDRRGFKRYFWKAVPV